jgi:hypothetical protein
MLAASIFRVLKESKLLGKSGYCVGEGQERQLKWVASGCSDVVHKWHMQKMRRGDKMLSMYRSWKHVKEMWEELMGTRVSRNKGQSGRLSMGKKEEDECVQENCYFEGQLVGGPEESSHVQCCASGKGFPLFHQGVNERFS